MKLRERLVRWWRRVAYYESHPLSDEERRAIAEAGNGVGPTGMRGDLGIPFGRPSIPVDERPRR